jgi:hypothetical protein
MLPFPVRVDLGSFVCQRAKSAVGGQIGPLIDIMRSPS